MKQPRDAISWRAGVHIAEPGARGLFCDALHPQEICFVSSAEVLGSAATGCGSLLCSERTFRIHQALEPKAKSNIAASSLLPSPTGRPFQLGALRLELFPSGAVAGGTALWLRLPSGKTLVYAGAMNPCAPFSALGGSEPLQTRPAEVLICHAPLAAVATPLPTLEAATADLHIAISDAHAAGALPIVLCPALHTAPALAALLAGAGNPLPIYAPSRLVRTVAACGGKTRLRRFSKPLDVGSLLLWPLSDVDSLPTLERLSKGDVRVLLCTGAALLKEVVAACEEALAGVGLELFSTLPVPDMLDRPGLLRYVAELGAKKLYLTAGYSDEIKAVKTLPLGPPRQLLLSLQTVPSSSSSSSEAAPVSVRSSLR